MLECQKALGEITQQRERECERVNEEVKNRVKKKRKKKCVWRGKVSPL